MTATQMWRTSKVMQRIAELKAMGLSDEEIASKLNEENKSHNKYKPIDASMVRRITQTASVRHKEFLQTDTEYAKLYKETLMETVKEGKENVKILNEARKTIIERLEDLKGSISDRTLMDYTKEIANLLRTQNDSLRTLSMLLERLESQQKEVKINQVQNVRLTLKALKTLEQSGVIKINPDSNIDELLADGR